MQPGAQLNLIQHLNCNATPYIMPSTVRRFRERFPDVELVLQEIIQPALEEYILSGDIDAGDRDVFRPAVQAV